MCVCVCVCVCVFSPQLPVLLYLYVFVTTILLVNLMILANCVTMLLVDPVHRASDWNRMLDEIERGAYNREAAKGAAQYPASPAFGDSSAPAHAVIAFYKHWSGFASCRTFAECDRYNWSEAENRAVRRAMEKENQNERKKVRFKYNGDIQDLVMFLKKRDPRMVEVRRLASLKEEEEAVKKMEEKKRKLEE